MSVIVHHERPLSTGAVVHVPLLLLAWSLQSKTSNTLMPPLVRPSPAVPFRTPTVLSLGSSSGPSACSRAQCPRISTGWSNVSSYHGNSVTRSSIVHTNLCALL